MPHLTTDDGISLYYEETGSGTPIVLVHEFADDYRGYEGQMRYFGRRYRAIAYNARGYPPSDVPEDPGRYSQDRARDDIRAVLDALAIDQAHIVGISMGGFATLHFGLAYPERALSLVVAGCGYGAEPGKRQQFHDETAKTAALVVFPNTGHAVNLEEPDLFNRTCADFFHQVESGRWPRRDPRSVTGSILGVR